MRWRIRCASSIRPSCSNFATCCSSSARRSSTARSIGRLRGHVLGRRPDDEVVEVRVHLARERVEVRDLLHLVAEERDAIRRLHVRRLHLDEVALHAEAAAPENGVVAHVLALDQLAQHLVAVVRLPHLEHQHALAPLLRRAEAVDARDGRDDDDVAAREERGRRREPKPRDVVVPGRVLLDVEVGLRDVRLGLEVVVVRDEVLDGVLGEELAELVAELRRERLVVRDHERGPLELLDRPRHRRRLARPGRAEDRLEAVPGGDRLARSPRSRAAGRPWAHTCSTRRTGAPAQRSRGPISATIRTVTRTQVGLVGMASRSSLAPADARTVVPPSLVCKLPQGSVRLPATARARARPAPAPVPRRRPGHAATASTSAARPRTARVGGDARTLERRPGRGARRVRHAARDRARAGDRRVFFFHAERRQEARGRSILDFTRSEGAHLRERARTTRSSSSGPCGARGTARSGRHPPGRSCAGTRTSSARTAESAA